MNNKKLFIGIIWITVSFWTGVAQSHNEIFSNGEISSTNIVLPGQSTGPEDDTNVIVFYPDYYHYDNQFPTVILLQGGLVSASSYSNFGRRLARFGFVVAIPNRLALLGPPPAVPFPDELVVQEVLAQLAIEDENPSSVLNGRVDVDNLGLVGHSVGGFVGLLVVEGSCVPPFCFPPFPFQRPSALKAGVFYGTNSVNPSSGELIDIDTGDIPVALVNGSIDGVSRVCEAQKTFDILDGPRDLVFINGANHYGITNTNNPTGAQPDNSPQSITQTKSIKRIARQTAKFLINNMN